MTTWLEDESGNKCSVEHFGSVEAAQDALDSLIDCENCINCLDCSHCSNCIGCSDCSHCSNCTNCFSCSFCSKCADCSHSSRCSRCLDCYECSFCQSCSACSHCHQCWQCSGCVKCSYCLRCLAHAGKTNREEPSSQSLETIEDRLDEALLRANDPAASDAETSPRLIVAEILGENADTPVLVRGVPGSPFFVLTRQALDPFRSVLTTRIEAARAQNRASIDLPATEGGLIAAICIELTTASSLYEALRDQVHI